MDMNALWEYQRIDLELEKYQKEVKNTPTRRRLVQLQRFVRDSQSRLSEMENTAVVKQNSILELEAQNTALAADLEDLNQDLGYYSECDDEELDIKEIEQMVKNCEKTYDAIAQVKKQVTRLKQEVEASDRATRELIAKMRAAKEEFDMLRVEHEKELAGGEDEEKELKKKLAAAQKAVPAGVLAEYTRIKGFRANPVAVLSGNRCGGCNMQLPANVATKVAASDKPVTCENCGRILILRDGK